MQYKLGMTFPVCESLPDGRAFIVDVITGSQITDMFKMIDSASRNSEGFGIDEFPTEADFRSEIKPGHAFSVMRKDCGEMVGGFVLNVSKYYRGTNVVDPCIIVKKCQRNRGIGYLCFSLCVQYAKQLGYMGMYVDTFSNNQAMINIIERHVGSERVGVLPMGGRMADGSIISSYVYYIDLRT